MAWTADLSKDIQDGKKIVQIIYTNGTSSISERFEVQNTTTQTYIAQRVKARIDALEAQDSAFDNLVIGKVAPSSPPAPTQVEIDQITFMEDYNHWLAVKRGIDAGIIDPASTAVVNLKAKVIAELKPAYINLL